MNNHSDLTSSSSAASFRRSEEEILGCVPGASLEDLRMAYLRLAKQYHPDKTGGGKPGQEFLDIQLAWETIVKRTEVKRKEESAAQSVDLDEMAYDEVRDAYTHPCRCGDLVVVPGSALEKNLAVFACPSCSLKIRVEYEEIGEEEG